MLLRTTFNSDEVRDYLEGIGRRFEVRRIYSEEPEEVSEDIEVGSKGFAEGSVLDRRVIYIDAASVARDPAGAPRFKYFIDGVVETRLCRSVVVGGVEIPIHRIVAAAGVFKREPGSWVEPTGHIAAIELLALPYRAVAELAGDFQEPPGYMLNRLKPFMDNIGRKGLRGPFWVDTSVRLSDGSPAVEPKELAMTGYLRRRALDVAKVIMRSLELWVLYELKRGGYEGLIAFDGPIAPLLIYPKMVSSEMEGLQGLADKGLSHRFLRDVVGCVKRVLRIPRGGVDEAFQSGEERAAFTVYRLSDVLVRWDEEPDTSKAVLSAFTVLRPALARGQSLASRLSTVARFDIPMPAIAGEDEDWYLEGFTLGDEHYKRLEEILKAITLERYPVPSAHGYRAYTELYPIYEAELWLKSIVRAAMAHTC